MIGISFFEVLVVLLVALLVVKPKQLPELMHQLGTFAAKLRRLYQMLQYQWSTALETIEEKNHNRDVT